MVLAGLFTTLRRSPYTLGPRGILTNFVFWGSSLVDIELIRAYLLSIFGRKRFAMVAVVVVAILIYARGVADQQI